MPIPGSVKFLNSRRIDEEVCMLPCYQKGKVLEFHMGSDEWRVHDICDDALSDIVFDGKGYWISKKIRAKLLVGRQIIGKIVKLLKLEIPIFLKKKDIYIIEGGEYLYLVPYSGCGIVKYDKKKGIYTKIPTWDDTVCDDSMAQLNSIATNAFSCVRFSDEFNYIYDALRGQLIVFNALDGSYRFVPMTLPDEEAIKIQKEYYKNTMSEIVYENKEMELRDYISYIVE